MTRRRSSASWSKLFTRNVATLTRITMGAGSRSLSQALAPALAKQKAPVGQGDWLPGVAIGPIGVQRYRVFRPPAVKFGERLPMVVMLHGCSQDAKSFAASTRMNVVAARERFLVLYPEQSRLSNVQGCWNWFDVKSGRAYGEAALIMLAINQACLLYSGDRERVAVAGLSSGASMAALLVTRYPERFRAVTMHSGIAPGTAHSTLSAVGAMYGQRSPKPSTRDPDCDGRRVATSDGDPGWHGCRGVGEKRSSRGASMGRCVRSARRHGAHGAAWKSLSDDGDRLQKRERHHGDVGSDRSPRPRMEWGRVKRAFQ